MRKWLILAANVGAVAMLIIAVKPDRWIMFACAASGFSCGFQFAMDLVMERRRKASAEMGQQVEDMMRKMGFEKVSDGDDYREKMN